MDTDETQILTGSKDYSLQPVTHQLLGAAFEVPNVLGYGFLERVYQRAMQAELQSGGLRVEIEPQIKVRYKGVIIGEYAAELLVEEKIIVELKTDPAYQPAHEAQLPNELRGTGIRLGYLINFGRERVEHKRMIF